MSSPSLPEPEGKTPSSARARLFSWPLIGIAVVLVLGVAGLARGASINGEPADHGHGHSSSASNGSSEHGAGPASGGPTIIAGDVRISGVYMRQPASDDVAAVYLSIQNTSTQPEILNSVSTGIADRASIHDVPGAPTLHPRPEDGDMTENGPVTVQPGQTLTFSPGGGHIMLEHPIKQLRAPDTVNILLNFEHSGQVLVTAPVIGIFDPLPSGATNPHGGH